MPKKSQNLKTKLQNLLKKDLRVLFPVLYVIFLMIFLVAFLIFPGFTVCSRPFGTEFCTPAGALIALVISLPGYFIAGGLLGVNEKTPLGYSLPVVFLTTLLFYFLLGLLIDKVKKLKLTKDQWVTYIILSVFFLLLVVFLFLKI